MIHIINPDFKECFDVFPADGAFVWLKSQCLRAVAAHTLEYRHISIIMIEYSKKEYKKSIIMEKGS